MAPQHDILYTRQQATSISIIPLDMLLHAQHDMPPNGNIKFSDV